MTVSNDKFWFEWGKIDKSGVGIENDCILFKSGSNAISGFAECRCSIKFGKWRI